MFRVKLSVFQDNEHKIVSKSKGQTVSITFVL